MTPSIAAAVAALFALTTDAGAPEKSQKATTGLVKCYGINDCMGKGDCAAPDASKNNCKAKGTMKVTSQECAKHGGTVVK